MIRPIRRLLASTTGNFSMRFCCRITSAVVRSVLSPVVMIFSEVMISRTGRSRFFSKRRSRFVRIPLRILFAFTTGMPPMLFSRMRDSASWTTASSGSVIGSMIMPLSERFTLRTSSAWACMVMFLWMTPIPPCWAIEIASADSVTVSIAAETMGVLTAICLVNILFKETSRGSTSEYAGARRTSS